MLLSVCDVVSYPTGIDKYDCEGRLITAEYDNFYFLTSCERAMLVLYVVIYLTHYLA